MIQQRAISGHMHRVKWVLGASLVLTVVLYNVYCPPYLAASVCFHFGFLIFGIVSFSVSAILEIRRGPDKERLRVRKRYWMTIFLAVLFVPLFGLYTFRLSSDFVRLKGDGFVTDRFIVRQNRSSVMGFWAIQRIKLSGLENDDASLIYILRFDLLREGRIYEITYSPRAKFILFALPVPNDDKTMHAR
jgi:hypothetical protein